MFPEIFVPDCRAVILNLVYTFMKKLDISQNVLIVAMLGMDINWMSRFRRRWLKFLYIHTDTL